MSTGDLPIASVEADFFEQTRPGTPATSFWCGSHLSTQRREPTFEAWPSAV